ncbi:MAG TPA: NAD(P)H-hydrate dehydratase [Chthoniobacterales bacterium]|jgi:NAD(P)H-hydrate epimerase|nr:NAD(P)H-hydrate dehydratase [Chthoniobacterales bacterium]
MRAAEEAAFASGIEVEALMDRAGAGIAACVRKFFPDPARAIVFAGKGHNGGDALVAARILKDAGWNVDLRLAFPEEECAELTRTKLNAFRRDELPLVPGRGEPHSSALIVLDGLIGLGAKHLLREPVRTAAQEINRLRREERAFVVAVDLPTGLDGDSADRDPDCVVADCTATIGFVKHGLVSDDVIDYVGRLEVIDLPELTVPPPSAGDLFATPQSLFGLLPRRPFNIFKNQVGRIGIVAGSPGLIGAALMTTEGALRGGAGLVELFVPKDIYPIVAAAAPAEAMVKPVRSYRDLVDEKMDVWAVGPGLGKAEAKDVLKLIERVSAPMVVDADGLNILAGDVQTLKRCAGPRLLTPHPGEMKRLADPGRMSRAGMARSFTDAFAVTLLLKGARTIVAERGRPLSYNSSGNPGMATGGMGDVLTGVCAALAGQGLPLYDAARIAAWTCGRAAEIAIFERGESEQSLLPRDVLANLGSAFKTLL